MTRQLVLVVGAGGQLGESMTARLSGSHETVSRTRDEMDLTVPESVRTTINSVCPDVIINCAAFTNVDAAEQDPLTALAVNAWGVRTLAVAAREVDATLVHYSTDFVFDGETDAPYVETADPNPRGTYAASKLVGEWFAAEAPRHYVLRVESLFGGPRGKSSIDRIIDGIAAGVEVRAFSDRTVSPSYVDDVVTATIGLLSQGAPFGLYHCVNSGWTTWSQLAREVAQRLGRPDAAIAEVPLASAALHPPRPRFAALSNSKLTAAGVPMPAWQDALARYIAERDRDGNA